MMKKKHLEKIILLTMAGLFIIWVIGQSTLVQRFFYPFPQRTIVEKYASQYGVDPLLIVSVMREESKFLPQSESHKGALGLMQLMPDTARWIAQSIGDKNFRDDEMLEPDKNIQYGTWYLASLVKQFHGNITLALAAYNGGRTHVNQWLANNTLDVDHLKVQDIPFPETRDYVQRVLKSYQTYIKLYTDSGGKN